LLNIKQLEDDLLAAEKKSGKPILYLDKAAWLDLAKLFGTYSDINDDLAVLFNGVPVYPAGGKLTLPNGNGPTPGGRIL
jgi:hypothetical protein